MTSFVKRTAGSSSCARGRRTARGPDRDHARRRTRATRDSGLTWRRALPRRVGWQLRRRGDIQSSARVVAAAARRRRIIGGAAELARRAYRGQDLSETIDRIVSLGSWIGAAGATRSIPGGQFILDSPAEVPALWGKGDEVLQSAGESLLIVGPDGVGKTTLASRYALARCGLSSELLGYPVAPAQGRVGYFALDRPQQIARSFGRMVPKTNRSLLDERLTVWSGPLPVDVLRTPLTPSGCRESWSHSANF